MRILLVEDDYLQADAIRAVLTRSLGAEVDRVATEAGFYEQFDEIARAQPDVIILDLMLRWTDPSPEMKRAPRQVLEEGPWRAGLRCERFLAEREETREIPILLFTVLEREDLETDLESLRRGVFFLQKGSDLGPLVEAVRKLRRLRGPFLC